MLSPRIALFIHSFTHPFIHSLRCYLMSDSCVQALFSLLGNRSSFLSWGQDLVRKLTLSASSAQPPWVWNIRKVTTPGESGGSEGSISPSEWVSQGVKLGLVSCRSSVKQGTGGKLKQMQGQITLLGRVLQTLGASQRRHKKMRRTH